MTNAVPFDRAARRTERVLGVVRVLAGLWGIALVVSYPDYPASHEQVITDWALVLTVGFLAASVLLWTAVEVTDSVTLPRAAALGLGLDTLVATGLAFVYGFDQISAVWIIVFLLPVEGAMRFQLRGAAGALGLTVAAYVGREFAWSRWIDLAVDWRSISFRMMIVAIVAVFVGLISEELRAQREVAREALATIEQSDQWRQRLVSALGHDLRGPIGNVEMQAQLARDPRLSDEQRDRLMDGIVRQARRVGRLAHGLLDLARAEQAQLTLTLRPVDVAVLAADMVELLGFEDAVEVDVESDLVVVADEDRLAQVLLNLLANARKHGAVPIELTARRVDAGIELVVRDHGDGIPGDLLATLFDEFSTGGGARSVGFGLHLVALIVEAHGGHVEVEDAAPGARFTVLIPDAAVVAADD